MKKYIVWLAVFFILQLSVCPFVTLAVDNKAGVKSAGSSDYLVEDLTDHQAARQTDRKINWADISVLNMKTAVKIALFDNPGIEAAKHRILQARAKIDQARSAYWPRLDVNAAGSRSETSKNTYDDNLATARFFNSNAAIDNPEDYYSTSLTATWVIFDGFERKFSNLAAKYGEKASSAFLEDTRRLLCSSVARTYFSGQLALENIAIAKADKEFNHGQLKDAQARYRVGTGSLSAVFNFQVRENQAKTSLINQEYEYRTTMFGLAALLGIPGACIPEHVSLAKLGPETKAELCTPRVEELIADAVEKRSDLRQARWNIKNSEAQISLARAEYYPSLAVTGSVEGERSEDSHFGQDDLGNRIQLSLSYNIFSGGATRASVSQARQQTLELEKNLEELILSVNADILEAGAWVERAQIQVKLQRETVDLVQRTRDLVEKEYNAGQASLVRLNEAQKDLTTARGNLALALVGLRQAWVQLDTRAGTILNRFQTGQHQKI